MISLSWGLFDQLMLGTPPPPLHKIPGNAAHPLVIRNPLALCYISPIRGGELHPSAFQGLERHFVRSMPAWEAKGPEHHL